MSSEDEALIRAGIDITSEEKRTYVYADGYCLKLSSPALLFITADNGHRVLCEDGWVTHIPKGWKYVKWKPKEVHPSVVA